MSADGTAASAARAGSIDRQVDPAYRDSYFSFQKKASSAYKAVLASSVQAERSTSADPYLAWLRYAAYVNTPAAYEFQCLAETIRDLQGRYNSRGNHADPGVPRDVLDYIETYQYYVIQRWMDQLKEWALERRQNGVYADAKRWSLELDHFHRANLDIHEHLRRLENCIEDCHVYEIRPDIEVYVDPGPALRAVHNIASKLNGIEEALADCVENVKSKTQDDEGIQSAARDQGGSLRRRRLHGATTSGDGDGESGHLSGGDRSVNPDIRSLSTASLPMQVFKAMRRQLAISDMNSLSAKSLASLAVDQSSLWALSILFTAISGILIGLSITQSRPAQCESSPSNRDDGFWALLSQMFSQMLTLYMLIVPLLRDKNFPVRRFWFCLFVATSACMSILSPAVYGMSWKVSALTTYLAGVSTLITSTQLTGGIYRGMMEPNLGTN